MTSTSLSARQPGTSTCPRPALLAMILLGVLGMHGLATSCLPSGDHPSPMSTVSPRLHLAEHTPLPMSHHTLAPVDDLKESSDQAMGGNHLAMAGMCIAALVGLVLALAVARARAHRAWWGVPRRIRPTAPRLRSRYPPPPTLAELSLMRC